MSTHTRTYNLLPTMNELIAFKNGNIKGKRYKEIQRLVASNSMVAEALQISTSISQDEVFALRSALSDKIAAFLVVKTTFWWKIAGWFSSIAILVAIFFVYNYQAKQDNLAERAFVAIESEQNATNNLAPPTLEQAQPELTLLGTNKSKHKETAQIKEAAKAPVAKKIIPKKAIKSSKKTTAKFIFAKKTQKKQAVIIESKTKGSNSVKKPQIKSVSKVNTTVLLNLQKVQILQKTNPQSTKVSTHSSSRYSPLGRDNKSKNVKTYAADDLPEYPGGDAGIRGFFRGIIRPVSVSKQTVTSKNRSCYVRILVNARGKIKETEIIGNPPKEIAKQLKEGLKKLPDFMPGDGNKVEYLISLSY